MGVNPGGILSGLLGGSSFISQIFMYQVIGQVMSALLQPYMVQAGYDVFKANPLILPALPDLADMVVKNIYQEGDAAAIAAQYGEDATVFHNRVLDTGEPPGLEQVLEWWRRGFLPWGGDVPGTATVENAIRTSRIYDYWTPVIQQAQFLPITAADAVNAWVRNQISPTQALKYLYENGLKAEEATILYHTVGRPPAPMQAATLVRRGVIPIEGTGPDALSFRQAIDEGDVKDKWATPLSHLIEAIPGVFELRLMQSAGGVSAQVAAKYYAMSGLPPDLVQGMVAAGSGQKLAGAKNLAQATITSLYEDQLLTEEQAVEYLVLLGYDQAEAAFVLDVADYKIIAESLTASISKTRAAFLARRITATEARALVDSMGVPADRAQHLLAIWEDEQAATIRILTEGQIVDAVYYNIADEEWAMNKLVALGYTPGDAYVLISDRLHAPAANPPPDAPPPPPPPPAVPATTTTATAGA